MPTNVADWLRRLGLEQYEPAFTANDIDAEVLPELTAAVDRVAQPHQQHPPWPW